jgi:hypothetical protein
MGNFFKGILTGELAAESMIKLIESIFSDFKKKYPDCDQHFYLASTWIQDMKSRDIILNDEQLSTLPLSETYLCACLPQPQCSRALGLYLLLKDHPNLYKKFKRFSDEFECLMKPVYEAENNGTLIQLYSKYNPKYNPNNDNARALVTEEVDKYLAEEELIFRQALQRIEGHDETDGEEEKLDKYFEEIEEGHYKTTDNEKVVMEELDKYLFEEGFLDKMLQRHEITRYYNAKIPSVVYSIASLKNIDPQDAFSFCYSLILYGIAASIILRYFIKYTIASNLKDKPVINISNIAMNDFKSIKMPPYNKSYDYERLLFQIYIDMLDNLIKDNSSIIKDLPPDICDGLIDNYIKMAKYLLANIILLQDISVA